MPTRKGNKAKIVYFTPEEWKAVCKNAEKCDLKVGTYIQRMALFGQINVFDFETLARHLIELANIGTNINQIAHKCNETGSVFKKDIDEVRRNFDRVKKYFDDWMSPLIYFRVEEE